MRATKAENTPNPIAVCTVVLLFYLFYEFCYLLSAFLAPLLL
jgi:hypothetical protein